MKKEIQKVMDEKGWTRNELAEKANINPLTLYKIFKNDIKTPRRATLRQIAQATSYRPIYENGSFIRFDKIEKTENMTVTEPEAKYNPEPAVHPDLEPIFERIQKSYLSDPMKRNSANGTVKQRSLKVDLLKTVAEVLERADTSEVGGILTDYLAVEILELFRRLQSAFDRNASYERKYT